MMALSGVRSSWRHVGQELALVLAGQLQLAALLSANLARPLLDLPLEICVGLLELRCHGVELVGQRLELVATTDLDPLVQIALPDASGSDLEGSYGNQHPAHQEQAGKDRHDQPQEQEQRCPKDRGTNGCKGLVKRLVDKEYPARRLTIP